MTTSPLTVRTARLADPGPLLDLVPEHGSVAWIRRDDGLVGWGVAAQQHFTGPDRFADAEAWWASTAAGASVQDEVVVRGTGPVAFGSFSFDSAGSSTLIVPAVTVGRHRNRWWVTTAGVPSAEPTPGELPSAKLTSAKLAPAEPARAPGQVRFADGELTALEWTAVVERAIERIRNGELGKVVLARDLEARTDGALDVRWVLQRLAAGYPECWSFLVDTLVGATPEMLVRLEDGVATSRVLAGTLRRDQHGGSDAGRAALASSVKDLDEHAFGVQSVAQALGKHCDPVQVPTEPFVLQLPNVLHLASDVTGVVRDGSTSLALLGSLHPSAAVCGTPTDLARELIRELEGMDRGRYTGPVGWLDASGDGEWGIALRCAEVDRQDPSRLRLFAGCGIVAGSHPQEELAETAAKLVPMRDALAP